MVKQKKSTNSKSRSVMGQLLPPVDITSASQLGELDKRIASGPFVLVFVYADWCGHCQRFKPSMSQLESMKNRSVQTVRIRDDVFPQSSIRQLPLEGYPSLFLLNNKGKNVQFKDQEGNISPTIPDYKNVPVMKSIVQNVGTPQGQQILNQSKVPSPTELANVTPANNSEPNLWSSKKNTSNQETFAEEEDGYEEENDMNNMNEEEEEEENQEEELLSQNLNNVSPNNRNVQPLAVTGEKIPTNIVADRLSSDNVNRLNTILNNSSNALQQQGRPAQQQGGGRRDGGLFIALSAAAQQIAPATALLLGAASYKPHLSKSVSKKRATRKRKQRGGRRGKTHRR